MYVFWDWNTHCLKGDNQVSQTQKNLQERRTFIRIIEDHPVLQDLFVAIFTFSGYYPPHTCIADSRYAVPDGTVLDADIFWYKKEQDDLKDFLLTLSTLWRQVSTALQSAFADVQQAFEKLK